jgi:hypothetical protein
VLKQMNRHILIVAWLLPLVLLAQAPSARRKPRPAPTGLKILSTTLEPPTTINTDPPMVIRPVPVKVQNVTDKTVVGYVLAYQEFDQEGKKMGDSHGAGIDFADPDSNPNNTRNFILPGQLATLSPFSVGNPETDRVEAAVIGVVYEDNSSEGEAAQMLFITRQKHAQEATEKAAKEPPGERKTQLEKPAAWYEAHGPAEAQQ